MRLGARRGAAAALALSGAALMLGWEGWRRREARELATIRRQVATSSTLYGQVSTAKAAPRIAYATESGAPSLVVASRFRKEERTMDASAYWSRPALSPDGQLVVAESIPADDLAGPSPPSLRLYDVATTHGEELVPARSDQELGDVAWAPDSRRLLYRREVVGSGGSSAELHVLDVRSRRDDVLGSFGAMRAPLWLGDGAVAFIAGERLEHLDLSTKELRHLARFPDGATLHRPALSPDQRTLALPVERPGDCARIELVDLVSGEVRRAFGETCYVSPLWFPHGDELAVFRTKDGERTLRSRRLDAEGEVLRGFSDGMVYGSAFASDGALLFTGGPADRPRAVWASSPDAGGEPLALIEALDPPLPRRLLRKPESVTVTSADGLAVPVVVFPRLCGDPRQPGVAVVWVHHENDFIALRWLKEIAFLNLSGATVFAVNYRGSFGYGPAFRARKDDALGKVDDIVATIDFVAGRADVDGSSVFLLHVSSGSSAGYGAVTRTASKLRGVIDLVGAPWPDILKAPDDALPPSMLWISGTKDPITGARRRIARLLAPRVDLDYVEYPGGHSPLGSAANARMLDAMRHYLHTVVGDDRCARP